MNARIKESLVRQHDQFDCGAACLASVTRYHGGTSKIETLRALSGTSSDGTTLLGLCEAARKIGFDAEGLEAESVQNLADITAPAILHVLMDGKLHHYVVFYGFDKQGKALIGDPAKGIVLYDQAKLDEIWKTRYLLRLTPNMSFLRANSERTEKYKWIYTLITEDITILIASVFLGVITAVLGLSTAIFSQKLIDNILPSGNQERLMVSLVFVFILLLSRSAVAYLRNYFTVLQATNFSNRIIQLFYAKLLRLPKSFYDTRKVGELIARMNDTRRIQNSLSIIAGTLVIDILLVLVSTIFVFAYSLSLGFTVIVSIPFYFLLVYAFNKRIIAAQRDAMSGFALTESHFIDAIQGIATIKLFNREPFFEKSGRSVYGHFQSKVLNLGKLNILFTLFSEIIGVVFIVLFFGLSAWFVVSRDLQVGEMVALLSMAGGIIPAINRIVMANFQIQESRVTFDRMYEFTSMKSESEAEESGVHESEMGPIRQPAPDVLDLPGAIHGLEIKVQNLSFRFPGRKQILRDVSMDLKTGELAVLLGESGSGKSTLMNVLERFYRPEKGRIEVNGTDLSGVAVADWRSLLGVVPQEVKIFNGSLLYNLTLSDDPVAHEEAIRFSTNMGFHKYFDSLPQSYFTIVGEEGINLSGGQKQLIAFARALFRKPRILFLDEPTAAMDRLTEGFVMDALLSLRKEMAILLITHKVAAAFKADMVYILEGGTVVHCGHPGELREHLTLV